MEALTLPPDLGDQTKYTLYARVPVLTTHVRQISGKDGKVRLTEVDKDQIKVICDNTNQRVARKEYPLVRIGHIDPSAKEIDQPPTVGFLGAHDITLYNGEPTIVADLYIKNSYVDQIDQYPRRSAEVFHKESPRGYIDAVALLARAPELDLGYLTNFSRYSKNEGIEVFECLCGDRKDNNMEKLEDETPESQNADHEEPDGDEGVDGLGPDGDDDDFDDEKAGKLGSVLGKHTAGHLAKDSEFCAQVGKKLGEELASNDSFLDSLITRMAKILDEKRSPSPGPSAEETPSPGEGGPGLTRENFNAGMASGTNTYPPAETKDENMDKLEKENENVTIGVLNVQLEELRSQLKAQTERGDRLEAFSKQLLEDKALNARRTRLQGIANDGVVLDVEEHLEMFKSFSDDQFETFAKKIETSYQRAPVDQPMIDVSRDRTSAAPSINAKHYENELTAAEFQDRVIEVFAKEQKIDVQTPQGGIEAARRYFKEGDRSKYLAFARNGSSGGR